MIKENKRIIIEIGDSTISFKFQIKEYFWRDTYYYWTSIYEDKKHEKELVSNLKKLINKWTSKENKEKFGEQNPNFGALTLEQRIEQLEKGEKI